MVLRLSRLSCVDAFDLRPFPARGWLLYTFAIVHQAGPDAIQMSEDMQKARKGEGAATASAAGADSRSSERRLAIRTRFCDDFFEDCAGQRGIKQVRLCGEGGA